MKYPTFVIVDGPDGQPEYRVTAWPLFAQHRQLWQAEALLQQLAASKGVVLAPAWYHRPLGFRSRPGRPPASQP